VAEGLLPPEIIYRKKIGFSSPITSWFKNGTLFKDNLLAMVHQKSMWQDLLNTKAIEQLVAKNRKSSVDYSYQLWALHNVLAF
jgi:asparagine synthase (glutamine-hydrolysing)